MDIFHFGQFELSECVTITEIRGTSHWKYQRCYIMVDREVIVNITILVAYKPWQAASWNAKGPYDEVPRPGTPYMPIGICYI